MQERREDGPLNGLWEFPGGKIEPNETNIDAVIREIHEEVELIITQKNNNIKFFKLFPYDYGDKKILLNVFTIQNMDETEKGKWFTLSFNNSNNQEIFKIIPKANIVVIEELLIHLIKTI